MEEVLGEVTEVDLFATAKNRKKERYCTVEKNKKAMARNAMTIAWTGFTALVHPPIPMIVRCLVKIQKDKTRAIVIAPFWRGMIWSTLLQELTVRGPVVLGDSEELLELGPGMRKTGASVPPGKLAAWLVQG
jgi:hypothetical protein